jgi:hypothetical protein
MFIQTTDIRVQFSILESTSQDTTLTSIEKCIVIDTNYDNYSVLKSQDDKCKKKEKKVYPRGVMTWFMFVLVFALHVSAMRLLLLAALMNSSGRVSDRPNIS